jgi:hypothetical protein
MEYVIWGQQQTNRLYNSPNTKSGRRQDKNSKLCGFKVEQRPRCRARCDWTVLCALFAEARPCMAWMPCCLVRRHLSPALRIFSSLKLSEKDHARADWACSHVIFNELIQPSSSAVQPVVASATPAYLGSAAPHAAPGPLANRRTASASVVQCNHSRGVRMPGNDVIHAMLPQDWQCSRSNIVIAIGWHWHGWLSSIKRTRTCTSKHI